MPAPLVDACELSPPIQKTLFDVPRYAFDACCKSSIGPCKHKIEALVTKVRQMVEEAWVHAGKRYTLSSQGSVAIRKHLLEEANELFAAPDRQKALDEAGDVLGCLIHLLIHHNSSIDEVVDLELTKLDARFFNPADVKEDQRPKLARYTLKKTGEDLGWGFENDGMATCEAGSFPTHLVSKAG